MLSVRAATKLQTLHVKCIHKTLLDLKAALCNRSSMCCGLLPELPSLAAQRVPIRVSGLFSYSLFEATRVQGLRFR